MSRAFLYNLMERVIMTALFAFLTAFQVGDLSTTRAAAVAGATAGLSLIKSMIGSQIGNPNSGSILPHALTDQLTYAPAGSAKGNTDVEPEPAVEDTAV